MPNLEIDPATTALVLIDLQNAIVARQTAPHVAADVVERSAALAAAMRQCGGTVVYVRVQVGETLSPIADKPRPRPATPPPPEASELALEAGFQPGDVLVTKRQWERSTEQISICSCGGAAFALSSWQGSRRTSALNQQRVMRQNAVTNSSLSRTQCRACPLNCIDFL